ncbi:uncharacterized protein LOC121243872 [Juglans microcarpa x Juglans regia]|uniref:uncharacterized protein LOC121243872 n=1 Tax=Juglans microcarpa x Juglans regia TaxID=2249226 RepID=UPI001B7E795C|nr:uncharacterized protein LOC121243872 [Juglans microcarpa x Juglans regia]
MPQCDVHCSHFKKHGATTIEDFRPSLVSGVYKIISKVLASRLSPVSEQIISKPQNTFICWRQILDSVLIAIECLDHRLREGVSGILCKLDMEKACDHVNLEFLLYLLGRCGFGDRWISWIRHCVASARFSVLVNSTLTNFFDSSRCLRQGDPLLPPSVCYSYGGTWPDGEGRCWRRFPIRIPGG